MNSGRCRCKSLVTRARDLVILSWFSARAVALYLLWHQVGLALVAGLGVVLLMIPINMLLTKKIAAVSA